MRRRLRNCFTSLTLMLGCLGLVECSAPQPVPVHSAFEGVPAMLQIDPQFKPGLGRLAMSQQWPVAGGDGLDWLLLGVKVQHRGRSEVWFVRVAEVIDPLEAAGGKPLHRRRFDYGIPFGVGAIKANTRYAVRCRRVRIETYDANGAFLAASSRLSPDVFPESTLFRAFSTLPTTGPLLDEAFADSMSAERHGAAGDGGFAELARSFISKSAPTSSPAASTEAAQTALTASIPPAPATDVDDPANQAMRDQALYGMVAMLQALGTTKPMHPIRDLVKSHVVEVPSIFGLLLSGLRPTLHTSLRTAQPLDFPWMLDRVSVPCYQADFAAQLAGDRFFDCRVVACPSVPPVDLIGGVLVIEVAHPKQPENRLTVRVLASSRSRPAWSPVDLQGYRQSLVRR